MCCDADENACDHPGERRYAASVTAVVSARMRLLGVRLRHRGRVHVGRRVVLGRGTRIEVAPGARLALGDGVSTGPRCRLLVRAGTLEVGDGAELGERCAIVVHDRVTVGAGCVLEDEAMVVDFDHRLDDPERAIRAQGLRTAPVHIGDGVRVGRHAAVLEGARIGPGAVVAPLSVVTRAVPAAARVAGVPARRAR